MKIAFEFHRRHQRGERQIVLAGATVIFAETVEYILHFPADAAPQDLKRFTELGGDLIGDRFGVIAFGNFVGRAELAGATIDVSSTKIGDAGVSHLLQEVSELASGLVFGWRSPTSFSAEASERPRSPVPYHQLQFLRRMMLQTRVGDRLQDWFGIIERSPTRRFEQERPIVPLAKVQRLDHRAIQSSFNRLDQLQAVGGSAIASGDLAQALRFGTPPMPHLPVGIAAPRGRLSHDTLENRFVKHVLSECLALVFRFVDHPKLHESLRRDCRTMLTLLEQTAGADYLREAGHVTSFTAPSQALAKADGYREVFGFWNDLTRHISLPTTAAETKRLLEGRDMATLYEYWVFLKVVQATSFALGRPPKGFPSVKRDELGESLIVGFGSEFGGAVTVRYNASYTRARGTAYSTPLRPDVVVYANGALHAFDAKYRLDCFDLTDTDGDDGAATYKRADLYKMHAYRDAIHGLQTAFVVYPGTEAVFFSRRGMKSMFPSNVNGADGVGAIALRPANADPSAQLQTVLKILLTQPLQSGLV